MFTLIIKEILLSAGRNWKLYLTNIIAILLIILLYAYMDGSRRQLDPAGPAGQQRVYR